MLFGVSENALACFLRVSKILKDREQSKSQKTWSEKGSFSGTGPYKHMHLLDLEKSIRQQ